MEEMNITVLPVTASGVGSFMDVIVNSNTYRSEVVQIELTEEVMKELMFNLIPTLPSDIQEPVELKFYQLLQALSNSVSTEAQPVEMIMDEEVENASI